MMMQDVLDLHRAGWSREEILAMMQVQQPQQVQQQESETVQLLREMLGMFRTNNINNMGGAPQSVDAAEILAANDYALEVKS